jgi:oxalate decarboxylase/phosphoglucose isomerase-like protein (cupin superfamily)
MASSFEFKAQAVKVFEGGDLFRASKRNFDALRGLAIQGLRLNPGTVREPHVHPNAEQLDYCVAGSARVGIVGPEGHREYLDLRPGDISFVPQGYLHWIENTGPGELEFLVVLSNEEPLTIELSEMLAGVPHATLSAVLGVPESAFAGFPRAAITISPQPVRV